MTRIEYAHHKGERAQARRVPYHVAIVMDGNGRWAKKHDLPRHAGHQQGKETVRTVVEASLENKIKVLTLFAFGQENWKRPPEEVKHLFQLFYMALEQEVHELHENGVKVCILGELASLEPHFLKAIRQAQQLTKENDRLILNVLINYSGRWDILQAVKQLMEQPNTQSALETRFTKKLLLNAFPEPDLFIRTAGVQRLSNFALWDLAYTELYFTPTPWPDFDKHEFEKALRFYAQQERRFGLISEQVENEHT